MNWLAMDIGCIECGLASSVIGVFSSSAEAQAACDHRYDTLGDFYNGGQHQFVVFELAEHIEQSQ